MHIYFSGIGGTGIGPLANIALDAGYTVSGSDTADSPQLERLRSRGARVEVGQDGSFIQHEHGLEQIDWLVYTSALPEDHPELDFARRNNIPDSKRHELLAHIIDQNGLSLVAVAGSHGKTTTTALLVWLCRQFGLPASHAIGSDVSFASSGHFDVDSQLFIYEADEYDQNFLSFYPYLGLVTNVDHDHPDTYPTSADYTAAFRQFIHQCQNLITWHATARQLELPESAGWLRLASQPDEQLPLAGAQNRANAQLALTALNYITEEPIEQLTSLLRGFPGASRRFEKLADNLYSDYGHHPTEIAATLQMARELDDSVVLVYQPHQNRRQHELQEQYGDCTRLAEKVYWLPTYLTREDPSIEELPAEALTANLHDTSNVVHAEMNDKLWQQLEADRNEGKLVLIMGAGDIDAWARQHLTA